jgi:hypothetical protein
MTHLLFRNFGSSCLLNLADWKYFISLMLHSARLGEIRHASTKLVGMWIGTATAEGRGAMVLKLARASACPGPAIPVLGTAHVNQCAHVKWLMSEALHCSTVCNNKGLQTYPSILIGHC